MRLRCGEAGCACASAGQGRGLGRLSDDLDDIQQARAISPATSCGAPVRFQVGTIATNHINRYDVYVNTVAATRAGWHARGFIVIESRSMNLRS